MLAQREPELSIVMPVYNEAEAIGAVVRSWAEEIERLGIRYEFLLYDDGSRDGSADALDRLAEALPAVRVTHHTNRGHGPSILRGYGDARGDWVLQVDSDGEVSPRDFEKFWNARAGHDVLIGYRVGRASSVARRLISRGAGLAVRALFGAGIRDVNAPYRLVRRTHLAGLISRIPDTTFAPNVLMSGLAIRSGLTIAQIPVSRQERTSGRTTLLGFGVWRVSGRALLQTLAIGLMIRTHRSD